MRFSSLNRTIVLGMFAVAMAATVVSQAGLLPDGSDPDLRLWLDASALPGADGTPIGLWTDSSVSGNNASAVSGGGGTLQTAAILGEAGKKIVRFDGNDSYNAGGVGGGGGLGTFNNGWTMFFVGKQSATGNQKWFAFDDNPSTTAGNQVSWLGSGNTGVNDRYEYGVNALGGNPIEPTGANFNVYSTHYDLTTARVWRDGVSKPSATLNVPGITYANMGFTLGQRAWANTGHFVGDVAEMVVYDRPLSSAEKASVELYLAGKYNLSHPGQTLGDGLVGYWRFEGGAEDFTDFANHGVAQNGAGFAGGKFGQALSLNGIDQFVLVADDPSLNPGAGSFTIAGWINVTDGAGDHALLGKGHIPDGVPNAFGLRALDDGNTLRGGMQSFPGGYQTTFDSRGSANLEDGEWYHIAMVVDRLGGTQEMFVDGLSLGVLNIAGFTGDMGSADPLTIGQLLGGSFANGLIDDTALWTRALTNAEISLLGANGGIELVNFVIPEPATGALSLLGGLLMLSRLRRKRRPAVAAR